ncbi:MAG: redoxin domain-containing protein [Akkermansiaceae bacterium]|jgi:peroxiredoxin|nr:redoxin domain-containing protein [Akkermansiaceae bacterium]
MKMKSLMGCLAAGFVALSSALAVEPGDTAPAFTLTSVKGESVSLADYAGKIVVLEWTNHDCPFVKKFYSGGDMQKLQETYTGKGVVWLTIQTGQEGKFPTAEKLAELTEKAGGKATAVLRDVGGAVGKSYDAKTTPHMFVIGKDGKVAYAGGIDDKKDTNPESIPGAKNFVVAALDALLAGKAVEVTKAEPYGCGVKY